MNQEATQTIKPNSEATSANSAMAGWWMDAFAVIVDLGKATPYRIGKIVRKPPSRVEDAMLSFFRHGISLNWDGEYASMNPASFRQNVKALGDRIMDCELLKKTAVDMASLLSSSAVRCDDLEEDLGVDLQRILWAREVLLRMGVALDVFKRDGVHYVAVHSSCWERCKQVALNGS